MNHTAGSGAATGSMGGSAGAGGHGESSGMGGAPSYLGKVVLDRGKYDTLRAKALSAEAGPFTYRSASITKLTAALAKAQKAFGKIEKTKTAGKGSDSFSYKYADLADVIAATVGPLTDNEIMLTQLLVLEQGRQFLLTELHHVSGEWLQAKLEIQPMRDPKAFGSTLTYARRYSEQAILNVAAEEDLDGMTPDDKGRRQNAAPPADREPKPPRGPKTPSQAPGEGAVGFVGDAVIPLTAPDEVKGKKLKEIDPTGIAAIQAYYDGGGAKSNKQMAGFKVIFDRYLAAIKAPSTLTPHQEFSKAAKASGWTKEQLKEFAQAVYKTPNALELSVETVKEFTKFVGMPYEEARAEVSERLAAEAMANAQGSEPTA